MQISRHLPLEDATMLYDVSTHTPGTGPHSGNSVHNGELIELTARLKEKHPTKFHEPHTLKTRYFFNQPIPYADGTTIPMAGFTRPATPQQLARDPFVEVT